MDQHSFKKTKGNDRRQRNSNKYKKYAGSNAAGQGFADVRKRKAQYEYFKMLKKMKKEKQQQEETNAPAKDKSHGSKAKPVKRKDKKQVHRFSKALAEANQKKAEQQQKREEAERRRLEREETRKKNRAERREKFLKLSKRTHKGQPIMRYRIENLLEEVEKFQQSSAGKS